MKEINEAILAMRQKLLDSKKGPKVGDYIIMQDGTTQRFSHNWDEDGLQTSGEREGRFYLGNGYCSFSGSLNPTVRLYRIAPQRDAYLRQERREGPVWFFDEDYARAGGGVDCMAVFNVWQECSDFDMTTKQWTQRSRDAVRRIKQAIEYWGEENYQLSANL